ncbi:hypothetical protein OGAPHI_007316 [Ogataea philodendri]|uniref:Uncharacterized protein n=1 Tax=Ogataea philodendri TaxID=1378263 RepID=A0A9P8T010_9ASCO|nr:uncharacterized protein OGAPHI_007316 [Ogataea philodendri]KAH3660111.1 hypothetical protein OGAPHI_007316 [Ogataea philodendri]
MSLPIRTNSSTSMAGPSRTPSGPVASHHLIMNKQASHTESLYYISIRLLKRLAKVPGMGPYLELAYGSAEDCAEQQAIALSSSSRSQKRPDSGFRSSEPLLGFWDSTLFTFSAGILPAQTSHDPVTPLMMLFQQGAPLCLIFNSLSPENKIELVSSDDLRVCKMSVYKFLSACKQHLNIRDDELFSVTSVFADDTNSLLKVIHAVNLVLDFESKFDAAEIPDQLQVNDSRSKVVREIVESERKFVQDLEILHKFRAELIQAGLISSENINMLFPNLSEIVDFQRRFLVGLECNTAVPGKYQRIGSVFLHPGAQGFQIYEPWSLYQNTAVEFINKEAASLRKSSTLINSPYELQSFLIKPVQRLCKYPLLLQELVKLTDPSWPNYSELHLALLSSKEVANKINESQRKSENIQLTKDLQDRVVDWKGYSVTSAGDLLYANNVTVKDLLTDGHSSEKEVHCYLFEKVIFFFKEVPPKNKLTSKLKNNSNSNLLNPQLSLNGIVYINKIYRCTPSESSKHFGSLGHFLTLRWKGSRETGGCVIRFRLEEQLVQWEAAIRRLLSEDEYFNRQSMSPSRSEEMSARVSSQTQSSNSSEHSSYFYSKLRTVSSSTIGTNNTANDKKFRSVSSPVTTSDRSVPLTTTLNGMTLNSVPKVNIKLIFNSQAVHLSVNAETTFQELVDALVTKLNYSFGSSLDDGRYFTTESSKFNFRDEDGDFIRFQGQDDWQMAKEMLAEIDDEEERILNISVHRSAAP